MRHPTPKQLEALKRISEGNFYPDLVREEDGWHARWRPDIPWLDEYVREAAVTPLTRDAEEQSYPTLHDAWAAALRSDTGLVRWPDAECDRFAAELRRWHGNLVDDSALRAGIIFRFEAETSTVSCAIPSGCDALRALGEAAGVCGLLRGMRRSADGRLSVSLTRDEAATFINHGARKLTAAGYGIEGCELAASIAAAAEIGGADDPKTAAPQVKLVIMVAGEPVSAEEIRFLLEQGSSLVFFRNRWIEVDRNILKAALRALEKSNIGKLSTVEALAFASGIGRIGRFEVEEVAAHGWLRGLLERLHKARHYDVTPGVTPQRIEGLAGELREYQRHGVVWMKFLTDNGFGALLADDMGLGKTVQTIAWMLGERGRGPMLIVAPLTLLSNWQHELTRFAPSLRHYVHHGHERLGRIGFKRRCGEVDVVLTSYTLLVRDHSHFADVSWHAMVLDEAQYVKNPDTAMARAIRALTPPKRIALTGTPVENSVSDIWSIEEFLNPGYLGDRKSFHDRFVKPLAADPHAGCSARLRHALEPFVLRRLKSDSSIAAELGTKREIREYCTLSARGRTDYELALADFRASDRKRGDIFALLTRLKLICDGEGKLEYLTELLERIFAAGESALVFTQYAKVGRDLRTALEKRFGIDIPFVHGALTARQREQELTRFNSSPVPNAFILTLKTGGTGLNLTRATHVIHYDRWWNPATESQATDRAHRIGQPNPVFVHLMMTAGTIEEHVDDILSKKLAMAGGLVCSGEAFLSQLPPKLFEKAVLLDE